MGTVYLADLRTGGGLTRRVAVKVLTGTAQSEAQIEARLRDEARLLGLLDDELLVGVADLVRLDGEWAVVMDYVDGADLSEVMARGPVPARALAEIGGEVAGALYRAHTAHVDGHPMGVVHRDVKPSNIRITPLGGLRLIDFGVARAAFSSREAKTRGLVLGTLNYLAPETLAGDPPTPAVDVFGLGQTLWEAATGRSWGSPLTSRERFERRVEDHLGRLPPEAAMLADVLRQMVQWDPALRPDAGVIERSLLHAASAVPGADLRTWARQVVPEVVATRVPQGHDDRVGRTWEVGAAAPSMSLPERPVAKARVARGRRAVPWLPVGCALIGGGLVGVAAAGVVAALVGVWWSTRW